MILLYKGIRYVSGDRVLASIEGINVPGRIYISGNKCWLNHNHSDFCGDVSPERFGYTNSWTFSLNGDSLSDGVVLHQNLDMLIIPDLLLKVSTQLSHNFSRFITTTITSLNNINVSYLFGLFSYRLILRDYHKIDISENTGMLTLENEKGRKMDIKFGRYIAQILAEYKKFPNNTKEITITTKDIEILTNLYISHQSSAQIKLEYLSGEDIKKGYTSSNCVNESTLSKSCMMNKLDFLKIYTDNQSVRLLVAKLNGVIIGRSIIWKLDNGMTYMDRVYSSYDWVANIFYNEAYNNNYVTSPKTEYFIKLENHNFTNYPYMDTFSYLSDNGFLYFSPKKWSKKAPRRKYKSLRNTDGHYGVVSI